MLIKKKQFGLFGEIHFKCPGSKLSKSFLFTGANHVSLQFAANWTGAPWLLSVMLFWSSIWWNCSRRRCCVSSWWLEEFFWKFCAAHRLPGLALHRRRILASGNRNICWRPSLALWLRTTTAKRKTIPVFCRRNIFILCCWIKKPPVSCESSKISLWLRRNYWRFSVTESQSRRSPEKPRWRDIREPLAAGLSDCRYN